MRKPLTLLLALAVSSAVLFFGCKPADTERETVTSLSPEPAGSGTELTIAIAGMVTPKSGLDYYKGLSEYMGDAVGKRVRIIHKADYAEVNRMLEAGKVDVAFVCSGPYVAGRDEFQLQLIAAPVVNGRPGYFSYIIVPKSSDATSLASLRGQVFAYTDPESNTGYIVPNYLLSEMGLKPDEFFSKTIYTYGHDNSIKQVALGEADGAAVDSLIYDYQQATNPQYTRNTRVVQKSEEFAIPPVVARPGLEPEIVEGIREALLTAHNDARGKELLGKMKIERFVEIDDSAYDSIRRMNELLAK